MSDLIDPPTPASEVTDTALSERYLGYGLSIILAAKGNPPPDGLHVTAEVSDPTGQQPGRLALARLAPLK